MKKSLKISAEDIALFRNAISDTLPIKHNNVIPEKPKPVTHPRKTETDNYFLVDEIQTEDIDQNPLERGDELLYYKPGVQKKIVKKLRRGIFNIEAELDLHGMTVIMATEALKNFLSRCRVQSKRCVRIIHGKGLGSKNKQPVIKKKLNHWLRQRDDVLAFCSASQIDGGTGAIYLLLKKSQPNLLDKST